MAALSYILENPPNEVVGATVGRPPGWQAGFDGRSMIAPTTGMQSFLGELRTQLLTDIIIEGMTIAKIRILPIA